MGTGRVGYCRDDEGGGGIHARDRETTSLSSLALV